MPLVLIGIFGLGAGYVLGVKTSQVLTVVTIGGIAYFVLKSNRVI